MTFNKKGGNFSFGFTVVFLGIQFAGAIYTSEGKIEITKNIESHVAKTPQFVHLAYYPRSRS